MVPGERKAVSTWPEPTRAAARASTSGEHGREGDSSPPARRGATECGAPRAEARVPDPERSEHDGGNDDQLVAHEWSDETERGGGTRCSNGSALASARAVT